MTNEARFLKAIKKSREGSHPLMLSTLASGMVSVLTKTELEVLLSHLRFYSGGGKK